MKICILSPSSSILVNSSPKGFFKGNCKLRQGDPLYPYFSLLLLIVGKNGCKGRIGGVGEGFSF